MIEVLSKNLHSEDVKAVVSYLEETGVTYAKIREGNECIWVSSGVSLNRYFFLKDHKITYIMVD